LTEVLGLAGWEQAELIRQRKLSPVELTQGYLDRIERFDGRLRAWIEVKPDHALAAAKTAEQEITKGRYRGPLHGIPYGLKDQIHALGFKTSLGTKVITPDEAEPPYNATVVERLNKAGAILLGKQNLHELGKGGTINFPFGQPLNPWHPAYTPSSTSTGSGTAVAARLCTFSIGEDTGGSIRGPASCNGVSGLRPTYGRVSRHGGVMHAYANDTLGPLARSVADIGAVLTAISGHDTHDVLSSTRPVPDFTRTLGADIRGRRIAIVREIAFGDGTSDEVKTAFLAAVEILKDLGAEIHEVSLPLARHAVVLQFLTADIDSASWLVQKFVRERYDQFDQGTRTRLTAATLIPGDVYSRAMRARVIVRQQIVEASRSYDALIAPTNLTAPKRIEEMQEHVTSLEDARPRLFERRLSLFPFSLSNLPALSVPAGVSDKGLPIGLQFIARPFGEEEILTIAHAYEQATAWHRREPDLEQTLSLAEAN
jgi:aspartyl-tRNA(Asn)/glutamyl-tRNA(Gln) amidotransferase subunit A